MDLKFKSPKWVGSICHTFETICHEVDGFVSQETVKYVENQAQAVGGSVKRFYSNVVQDLLPSSLTQPGKNEAQILSLKHAENDGINISCSDIEDLDHSNPNIVVGENDLKGVLLEKKSHISSEENNLNEGPMGKTPHTFEKNELKEECRNTNTIANNVEINEPKEVPSQPKSSKEINLLCPEKASLLNDIKIEVTCDTYISDINHISDLSSSLPPSEMNFSVISVDNKTADSEIICSDSPLSSEIVETPHNKEDICYYLVDENESASDPLDDVFSSQTSSLISCDDRKKELALSSCAFNEDVPSADEIDALVASLEDNTNKDYANLEAIMSFLKVDEEDDCTVAIEDTSMVTIELSDDNAKLDENCVHMENKLLYAIFSKSQKNKSYKKILQEAFASRKRLRKEYEQLGILFGEIDIEPQSQRSNIFPEILSSSLGSEKLPSSDLSEWEIL